MKNEFEIKSKMEIASNQDLINRIKKIEDYENIKLPVEYIEFIKHFNGCIPSRQRFSSTTGEKLMERFLCIVDNLDSNRSDDYSIYDTEVVVTQIGERLTSNHESCGVELYPIALLFSGDFICLDYRNLKKEPSICIWSHDESDEFSPVTHFVAENFIGFLNMLY